MGMYKPFNAMENGANGTNLESLNRQRHPVDIMQRKEATNPFKDLEHVRHVYGSGLAMRLATEQKIAREQEVLARGPGLPTSNLYRDIVTGTDTTIGFEDFLSFPETRPTVPMGTDNPHRVLERQMGW